MISRSFVLAALLTAVSAAHSQAPNPKVATPESVFGFRPGEDNRLDSWADVKRYYEALDRTSDRVKVQTLGRTTEGRPYLVAIFSAPETLKRLSHFQDLNARLSDPRRLKGGDAEAETLIHDGKAVVIITAGIHSNEVASYLSAQNLAYRLAAANDEKTLKILQNTIVVLVPSLNPDGVDIVKGQFDASLKSGEASPRDTLPNPLYHKYIGHDDNRDWLAFTQVETRIAVEKVINPWHPQVLQDIHQQGSNGPRLTLPPYTDPVEPNIPRQLVAGYTELGTKIAADLTGQGFEGVIAGSLDPSGYDAWSPLRQYTHFHNAVRILQESASARIAAPLTIDGSRVQPNTASEKFPKPWKGGVWRVGDAVKLAEAAAVSLLDIVSTDREKWLRTAYEIAKEAVQPRDGKAISSYLLPPSPARDALLSILQTGAVEFSYLKEPLAYRGATFGPDTAVVRLDQPYGAFAAAILSKQRYPDLLDASGRPVRPYDVTAHTLPLLLNAPAVAVEGPLAVATRRARAIGFTPIRVATPQPVHGVRLALLQSNSIDEGWTRWVLEQNHVPYTLVRPDDLGKTLSVRRFDALLIPAGYGAAGRRAAGDDDNAPNPSQPGDAIKSFVEAGGTAIALNRASNNLIDSLQLPVKDVTQGLNRNAYFVPGSILTADLDWKNPLVQGVARPSIVWAEGSPAFEIAPGANAKAVAWYPRYSDPLASGWLLGADVIRGRAALVEASVGKGRAILFGFKPNYRGISLATYPLLFNAIQSAKR